MMISPCQRFSTGKSKQAISQVFILMVAEATERKEIVAIGFKTV
jgi:hypothetical protein